MLKFLCKLGFHAWRMTGALNDGVKVEQIYVCRRCKAHTKRERYL